MIRPIVKEALSMCKEEYIDECQENYEEYIDVLEKALDITIDLIYGKKGSVIIPHNRRAYKEWVLKESEKR